jgi:hypothetical protein
MIPKIAFLFLAISDVFHQNHWRNFFHNHENEYSIYVHSKQELPQRSFFRQFEMAEKVPTTWANTMHAQRALLKEALKDATNQKFVFVSETTIPVASFERVYHDLFRTDKSIFDFWPSSHLEGRPFYYKPRILKPLSDDIQYISTQWIVLNRKHAELMVKDDYYISIATRYPSDQEHYPATLLAAHNLLDEVEMRDTTFVLWEKGPDGQAPFYFHNLDDVRQLDYAKRACARSYLFARKFHKDCNLKKIDQYLPYM